MTKITALAPSATSTCRGPTRRIVPSDVLRPSEAKAISSPQCEASISPNFNSGGRIPSALIRQQHEDGDSLTIVP